MWQTSHKIWMTQVSSYYFNELIYIFKLIKETTFVTPVYVKIHRQSYLLSTIWILVFQMYQKSNICNLRTLFHDLLNNLCCTPSLCLIIVRNNYLVPFCTIYYIVCNVHLWPPYPQWPPTSPASGLRDHSVTPVILNSRLPNLYNTILRVSHSVTHIDIKALPQIWFVDILN